MPAYFPVYVCRSDGRLDLKDGRNEPLPNQLDPKPNSLGLSDFYRFSPPGDPKELEWRRKLGGMLMRELQGSNGNGEHSHASEAVSAHVLNLLRKESHPCRTASRLSRLRAYQDQTFR